MKRRCTHAKNRVDLRKPNRSCGFSGYLHVDAYERIPAETLVGCWAHARRQFDEALKALPASNRSSKQPVTAEVGLDYCNWLLANTPRGAASSAIIYSIIQTAKENDLKPLAYLTYLFEQLPNMDMADPIQLDTLLPWWETIPDVCKMRPKLKCSRSCHQQTV